MVQLLDAFLRTKHFTTAELDETKLKRCLSTFDLAILGIGCTLGAGVYVVTGEVARNQAGPAIVISFAIAAVASLLSGLCYAEFGARVPKAGSAYIYSYVTIGELCAFVIGWNMLLEYIMGAAAIGKAWSDFFNALCDDCIKDFFIQQVGSLKLPLLGNYPDFLAFSLLIVLTIVIIAGAAESSALNWLFTCLNLGVIIFVTVAGLVFAETKNWDNFSPFGFQGVMSGAATCFFAFVGFDVIATSGEEAKNPRKAIPIATIAALFVAFVAYECVSVTLTLMLPYDKLPKSSALATAFDHKDFSTAKYIVAVGAICGLSSSALVGMFPIPRIMYAMASDRLIFSFFARVNERTGTPIIACAVSGVFTAFVAMFLDLAALAEMLSIGTLLAYTIVSFNVLLLRYKPGSPVNNTSRETTGMNDEPYEQVLDADIITETEVSTDYVNKTKQSPVNEPFSPTKNSSSPPLATRVIKRILGPRLKEPTQDSYLVVKIALAIFILDAIGVQCCLIWGMELLQSKNPVIIVCFVLFLMWMLLAVDVIARQPESKTELTFKVPFLPFLPLVAVFVDMFLLLELQRLTWIRFGVWMAIGMLIYLFYGVKNSTQNKEVRENGGADYMELANSIED